MSPRNTMLLLMALVLLGHAAGADEHEFVGAEKCKSCHKKELIGNQFGAWLEDPHHRAFETLRGDAARSIATQRGLSVPPHESPDCLRCHITAFGVPAVRFVDELDPEDGVQCESCHGAGRDFRKKDIMSDRELALKKGLWDAKSDEAICTRCHNTDSPTFDPARYTSPDGTSSGFLFEEAKRRIAHPIPEDVKGHIVEIEEKLEAEASEDEWEFDY